LPIGLYFERSDADESPNVTDPSGHAASVTPTAAVTVRHLQLSQQPPIGVNPLGTAGHAPSPPYSFGWGVGTNDSPHHHQSGEWQLENAESCPDFSVRKIKGKNAPK